MVPDTFASSTPPNLKPVWYIGLMRGGKEHGVLKFGRRKEGGKLAFNCVQADCTFGKERGGGTERRNYKNPVGLWSLKPSVVIYCTLKARSGIYSGSGDFPCKAAGLTRKPGLRRRSRPNPPASAQLTWKPRSFTQAALLTGRADQWVCAVGGGGWKSRCFDWIFK